MRYALFEEESKTDYVMDRLAVDPEFKEFMRKKLKALADLAIV